MCDDVLSPIAFDDLNLVATAISASGAQEGTDYQRLEFLGDSILKLFTSITLMAEYPRWHEGFLSAKKDRVVANARLSRAAVEVGLDRYILTKSFTGHKWRPLYNSELLRPTTESKRQMSTKILADVVEALIGAAYLDGAVEKALSCLEVFLPEIPWLPLSQRHASLYDTVTPVGPSPPRFIDLERLIGYNFNKKTLLIEAMTHPSYSGPNSAMSYQRLEFLGDSVLDYIVVAGVFGNEKELKHYQMHMRTARQRRVSGVPVHGALHHRDQDRRRGRHRNRNFQHRGIARTIAHLAIHALHLSPDRTRPEGLHRPLP
jgi:dsRNA-specific ribonuclease